MPTALTRAQWQQIPAERVHEVAGEYRDEATGLLATVSSRRITASEAERFIGRGLSSHAGASFYLLRSVRTPTRNGHYDVLTHERSVQVLYSALSRRSDTEKSAIVVELDASPETVYVEVTIAS